MEIYDESDSSDDNEDEEEVISQKNLKLDPVEEKVSLVENIHSCPFSLVKVGHRAECVRCC